MGSDAPQGREPDDKAPAPPSPNRPLLIYDGDCSFCKVWVGYAKKLTGDAVEYKPYQEIHGDFPQISVEQFRAAAKFVDNRGRISSAAEAIFRCAAVAPEKAWLLWSYQHVPGWAAVSEGAYRWVARHRSGMYAVTRLLWGKRLEPARYETVRSVFLRLMAAIYFLAFASWLPQIPGLIGSRGIQPAATFLQEVQQQVGGRAYYFIPSLAWLHPTDAFLRGLAAAGLIISVVAMLGIAVGPGLLLLWVLYLSQVVIGQVFMSFQWDALLLESGFLAIFLAPWKLPGRPASRPSVLVVWLFRWLMFRFMLSSGLVKLASGDPTWRNLTALSYHYLTQPLPTVFAWYMYQLPLWFQKVSAVIMFAIELSVPLLIFASRRFRALAVLAFVFLETLIFLTGNYTFFNLLTVTLCIPLLDDGYLPRLLPNSLRARMENRRSGGPPAFRRRLITAVVAAIVFIAGVSITLARFNEPVPDLGVRVAELVAPFQIANSYGLFAEMTTDRNEIEIEGSDDGENWTAYRFKYKPGDLREAPRWVQPYQPRLDWQMWFAALGNYRSSPWLVSLALRLLEGSPDVERLFAANPFPNHPPRYIRALIYRYGFTSWAERRSTGNWWTREYLGAYLPPIFLR